MALTVCATPARRSWQVVALASGDSIEVMLVGDEHGHWLVDRSGNALRMNDDGKAEYVSAEQLDAIKTARKARVNQSNARRMAKISKTRAMAAAAETSARAKAIGQPTTVTGDKRGLVILVNFTDRKFKTAHDQELFDRRFNEEGYSDDGYVGSVHDYFYDQSYGKFNLTFDVVGPVSVSKSYSYYGSNASDGYDKYPAKLVIEALKLVDAQGVDFSKYDWDGDGEVDQIFIIYAGTGEAQSKMTKDIWPHEASLSLEETYNDGTGSQTIDGVTIDTYAMSCELSGNGKAGIIDGIGTACHEFAHCLGYADLYDTDYSGGWGMEYWDLMDGGEYTGPNNLGEVPPAFTSFERIWAGWMEPIVLDKPQYITDMPAINDEGVAYKIVNDAHPDEYYLLENRKAEKWDSYTACDGDNTANGLFITHVDYDQNVWEDNTPNDDPKHQRMTFVPGDNDYGSKTSYGTDKYIWKEEYPQAKGDLFGCTYKIAYIDEDGEVQESDKDSINTVFTDETSVDTLYNANTDGTHYLHKPVTDIVTSSDGLVSFTFMGGENPSGIETVTAKTDDALADEQTYNILGQHVDNNYKGIVIRGRKKFAKR